MPPLDSRPGRRHGTRTRTILVTLLGLSFNTFQPSAAQAQDRPTALKLTDISKAAPEILHDNGAKGLETAASVHRFLAGDAALRMPGDGVLAESTRGAA